MAHLTLVRTSEDGRRLHLVDEDGAEHTLDVDDRLRAALRTDPRGPTARTGQMETRVDSSDSALRPRDIQARIRSGESPEALADAAGTSVERVLVYARPVLAERAHVADRAQRSSVRRRAGEQPPGGARTLGDAVAWRLRALDVDPDTVEWDAWRREDGRWSLTAAYAAGGRSGTAAFTFDPPGNYVTLEDDDARWLVGEEVAAAPAPARDDLEAARRRRQQPADGPGRTDERTDDLAGLGGGAFGTVGDGGDLELPLGADALALVREADPEDPGASPRTGATAAAGPEESTLDLTETAARVRGDLPRGGTAGAPRTAGTADTAADGGAPAATSDDDTPAEPAPEPPEQPARKPSRRGRRASVPSWDEIMFGGGDKG